MVSSTALVAGLALLCWPPPRSVGRLRALAGKNGRSLGWSRVPRPTTLMVVCGAAGAGWLPGGPGGAIAAALVAGTAWRRLAARRRMRQAMAAVDGMAEALRSLVAELRSGAHPAVAAESAAIDAEPAAAVAMRSIAAVARLDGDVERALITSRTANPATARVLAQLAQAWILVRRHGLPLADVLDAVHHDLDTRARFARQVLARMAGPRASATILALLPAVGIALGEAMGARPVHVLAATTAGQLLLVIGTALTCAGIAWSARLTNQAVLA